MFKTQPAIIRLVALASLAFHSATETSVAQPAAPATSAVIKNHISGSTVRCSVALLRGSLPEDTTSLSVSNADTPKHAAEVRPVRHDGKFKALVELSPGVNNIRIETQVEGESTPQTTELELRYEPQTNPYYVRLIWLTDKSGETPFAAPTDDVPQDYESRLRTAALLMQTMTAERMNDLGYGRITFRLERDEQHQIIVHTFKGPKSAEEYYALGDSGAYYRDIQRWLNRTHPDPFAKNIVLAAFTRKDEKTGKMKGHTALGGGNMGLFGSASVFSWPRDIAGAVEVFNDGTRVDPTRVHDDSAGRSTYSALAATTIGATLHEMAHSFGLLHCADRRGIMTRGFDYFNRVFTLSEPPNGRSSRTKHFTQKEEAYFAPISASFLKWSLWFRIDQVDSPDGAGPKININDEKQMLTVTSDAGIPWVGFCSGRHDCPAHREFYKPDQPLPKKVTIPLDSVKQALGGKKLRSVIAIDGSGQLGRK